MAKKSVNKEQDERSALGRATVRSVRMSPQKARLMVDLIRGKQVEPALQVLQVNARKGARIVEKLLRSAIMNAKEHMNADVDRLWVNRCWVDGGRPIKRYMPRAHGSANQILKRSSHITLVVGER